MIAQGSKVQIHYTLTVDGQVADSSEGQDPLGYEQGKGMIIPGLEEALVGKKPGDSFEVSIESSKAYGDYNDQAVQRVPKEAFGEQADQLEIGGFVTGEAEGQVFQARVVEVAEADVLLDLNHPLAGKTLHFAVEVVSVD